MKKVLKVMTTLVVVGLLCGCTMKAEFNAKVNSDKSMDISVTEAFDNELIDAMINMQNGMVDGLQSEGDDTLIAPNEDETLITPSEEETLITPEDDTVITPEEDTEPAEEASEITDEQRWQYLDSIMTGEEYTNKVKYEEGEFKGYTFTNHIASIDDVVGTEKEFNITDMDLKDIKSMFTKSGDVYTANWIYANEDGEDTSQITMDMKVSVTLPKAPKTHNATNVSSDGKTLTWDLSTNQNEKMQFSFAFDSKSNQYMTIAFIAGGVIIVFALIAVGLKVTKKGKVEDTPVSKPETPVQPTAPVQPSTPVQPTAPVQPSTPVQPKAPIATEPVAQPTEPQDTMPKE